MMLLPLIVGVVVGLLTFAKCQQPLHVLTENSSAPTAPNITSARCEAFSRENERLRAEVNSLKGRLQMMREAEEEDSEESSESHAASRHRRGVKCDAGTLAAWACAPQCVFKLKGLCGLSLKTICHC